MPHSELQYLLGVVELLHEVHGAMNVEASQAVTEDEVAVVLFGVGLRCVVIEKFGTALCAGSSVDYQACQNEGLVHRTQLWF
jgi:hypothetical protein